MFVQAIFQRGKRRLDAILSLTLKTNFENDGSLQKEFSPESLKIIVRKDGDNDLLRPIGGAHPCQADDGKSALDKASDKNLRPSSVITVMGEKDVQRVRVEEIATMPNAETSVNSSDVDVKVTHPLQETEGPCTIPQQEEGQPATTSQSGGKAKMQNAQALREGDVPETKDKIKQQKLGCKKIVSSRKEENGPTCREPYVAKRMSVTLPDHGFETQKDVTLKAEALLEGVTKDKVKQQKLGCKKIVKKKSGPTCHQENVAKRMSVTLSDHGYGTQLDVTLKAEALLEGETEDKAKQQKLECKKIVSSRKKENNPTCHQQYIAKISAIPRNLGTRLNVTAACFVFLLGGVQALFKGPNNQVVMRGERAVLPCFTDIGYDIKWFKNHELIYSGYEFTTDAKGLYAMSKGSGHYDLIINSTDERTAGFYTCQQHSDVKTITARVIVLDVNSSTVETNVTAEVYISVITGNNRTRLLLEIIPGDNPTNATGTVTLINSDTVGGIRRQNMTSVLILSGSDFQTNNVCSVTLVFNDTERSAITLGSADQMADNVPTYAVEIPCNTSVYINGSNSATNSTGTDTWTMVITCIFVPLGIIVIVIVIVVVVYKCYQRKGHINKELGGNRPEGYEVVPLREVLCSI